MKLPVHLLKVRPWKNLKLRLQQSLGGWHHPSDGVHCGLITSSAKFVNCRFIFMCMGTFASLADTVMIYRHGEQP